MSDGEVFSIRLDGEEAREVRWAAREYGKTVSDLFRRGLRPVLAQLRADWYEKHGTEDDWEVVGFGPAGPRRKIDMSFGVLVTSEQLHELLPAAEACGLPLSAFMRTAALALAASMAEGGTARCGHLSMAGVTSAECQACGPLPISYAVSGTPSCSPPSLAYWP
jgi:hypothetical protein